MLANIIRYVKLLLHSNPGVADLRLTLGTSLAVDSYTSSLDVAGRNDSPAQSKHDTLDRVDNEVRGHEGGPL